jgi:hypothetical protein
MVADIKEHTKMLQFIVCSIDVLIIGNALLELARTSVKKIHLWYASNARSGQPI